MLTLYQLKRRGWTLAHWCLLCGEEEESIGHILIRCPMVWELWTTLFLLMGGQFGFLPPQQETFFGGKELL